MSHNLKNIYPRMLNTMWTLIQTCTLIPTPFTRTCASRMAHRLRQTSLIFRQVEILLAHRRSKWANSEAGKSFQPFHKLLCPKTAPCPEAATQATTTAAAADQAADHCKAFPKPLRVGFWLAAILTRSELQTRCKRGPNVRNQYLGDWPPKSPDKLFGSHTLSLLFRTVRLKSFQRWSRWKPSQAAAAGKSKEREEETKGE